MRFDKIIMLNLSTEAKMTHQYSVRFRYNDRKRGPEGRTIRTTAASQPVAISKASREFWKSLTRKERFDAGKELQVVCVRLTELQDGPPEVYAMVDSAIAGRPA
jgi:hypothetical protein